MYRLGRALHAVKGKVVIVEITGRPPRIGSLVYDSKLKVVGRVVDVIGPVSRPYAVVKPISSELLPRILDSPKLYYKRPPRRASRR